MNLTQVDEKSGRNIMYGEINRHIFDIQEFKTWFDTQYTDYKPDSLALEHLKNNENIDKVKIIVVLGSWCSDSRREVPRFYKILDEINFPEENLTVIAVDRTKSAKHKALKNISVEKVPTFYFFRDKKLAGEIIETPKISLEQDMVNIFFNLD